MNRKTVLSILAAIAALCLLTACGAKEVHPAEADTPPVETVEPEANPAPVGENQFVFTRSNFPRLDGSTSTLPLGQAVASVLLGESREKVSEFVRFSKTTHSYRALMNGDADLLLSAEPAAIVWAEKDDGGYDWDMAPFAVDGLVFVVNASNPVDSLTPDELRGIYNGTITNWAEVGGENLEIVAFQRDEEAGSQTAMMNLVMMGEPMTDAPTELVRGEMGDLVEAVATFDDSPAAIGYTMYYYAHNMNMADGLKILSVDGVAPDAETIRNGSYPFRNSYYVVTDAGRPDSDPAKLLYDWILSPDGQRLMEHEGYIPVSDLGGGGTP
ncbi:MAG: substrate-binding domain-containing protein [Oscillibacter sp.]|nr:substrate-binding domain-containing protein [Oscillibacter sp.]